MSKYLMMVGMTALVVVAIMNGASKEKASWGKVETEILVPDTLATNAVTAKDDVEEVIFKCRKEVTSDKAASENFLQPNSIKANE